MLIVTCIQVLVCLMLCSCHHVAAADAVFLGAWRVYFMVLRYAGEGFGVGAQGIRNFAAAKHD